MIENKYLTDIFKLLPTPSLLLNANAPLFTIVEANDLFLKLLNKTAVELNGKSIFELLLDQRIDTDAKYILLHSLNTVIQNKIQDTLTSYRIDIHINNDNKNEISYWDIKNIPFLNKKQELKYIIQCFTDVTQRKESEDQLKLSEITFRNLLNNISELIYIHDEHGNFIEVNETVVKTFGYDRNFFIGKSPEIFAAPGRNDMAAISKAIHFAWNGIPQNFEFWAITKDGKVLPKEMNLTLGNYFNKPVIIAVARDITEKIQAQQSLLASEERFKALVEFTSVGIIVHRNSCILFANPTAFKMIGAKDEQEVVGKSFINYVHPDFRELVKERIKKIPELGTIIPKTEEKYIRFDGSEIIVEIEGVSILYEGELAIQSSIIDITQHKKIEADLSKSETLLTEAQRVTKVGSWETNLQTFEVTWSAETYRIFETDSNVFEASHTSFLKFVHPDDKEKVDDAFIQSFKNKDINSIEHRIITANQNIKYVEERWHIQFDDNQKPLTAFGTCQDITERKLAEIAAETSETKFKTFIQTSPDGIVISDLDGNIQFVNNVILEMFGFESSEDFTNKSVYTFINSSSHEKTTRRISEMLKGIFHGASEYLMVKKDGSTFYCDVNGNILKDSNALPNGIIYVLRDSTKKKKEQHHLKLLESVITHAKDVILITEAEPVDEPGPRILYVNDAFTKTTGYTVEEAIGKNPRFLQGEKSDKKELKRLSESIRKWEPCEISTINYKKDGTEYWVNFSITPVADEKGWYTHWVSIQRDITEQKRAEEQILTSNLKLATLLDAIPDIMFEVDIEGRIYNYHTHQTELLATTPEQFLGKTFAEVIEPKAAAICEIAIKEASEKGLSTGKQYVLHLPQGERWFEISVSKLQLTIDKMERYIVLARDITIRKKAENELIRSKKILRNVLDNAPIGIWLMGVDGRMEFVNKVFCDAVGITEEQFLAVPHYSELYPGDLAEACMLSDKAAIEEEGVHFSYENLTFTDGKMHQLEIHKNKVYNDNNPNPSIIGLMLDITESEKTKEDLSKTANFLLEIQKITDTGTYELDIINNRWTSSEILNSIFGIDETYDKNFESWSEMIHPDCQETISDYFINDVLVNKIDFNKEYQIVRKSDNKVLWVHGIGKLKFNTSGEPIAMIGTIRDITERKESEEKIKISNDRYNLVAKATSDAIWDWNLITDEVLRAGDGVEKLFGYEPNEILNDNQFWQELVHPNDLERVRESVFKAIANPKEHYWEAEFSILNTNGEYVYVYDKGYILRDEKGKAMRMIGSTKNVDKRKRTEIALKESELRYKTLIELSPEPIIVNCHDKIVYVNPSAVKMFGGNSAEEILNMSSVEFIVPEFRELTLVGVINILRGKTDPELTEVQLYKLDGTIIDVEAQGIAIEYFKEPAIQISMRDITKRKQAEIEKNIADEKIRRLSTAIEQVPVSVVITELDGNINYVNPKFTEMTGYTSEEVIGKNPKFLQSGYTTSDEYKNMWEKLINGDKWNGIFNNKKKNGELFWESALITPIKNESGEIINFMALKEDITARKLAEESVLSILEEKNTILESIGDAFFAVNNNWVITYWNKHSEVLLEKTKDEVLGCILWDVFSNTISTEAFKNYHKAFENKQVIHFEDYYAPLKKWYEVSVYPSEKGLAVYFKDISERIQYTTAIELQNKKLHEIAWMQSHIARAPLSRMMGIVDVLKDSELSSDEFKEWVQKFITSSNELDDIIKEITKKSEQIM